jgi:uncharacterized protein YdcH (DUF465 family)
MKAEHPPPEGQIGLPLTDPSPLKKNRSRRGVEEKEPIPPNKSGKNSGFKREYWQLLKDEQSLNERIKHESTRNKPDKELMEALKKQRIQVREEMKSGAQLQESSA